MGGSLTLIPIPIDDAIALPKRPEFGKGPDPQEGRITRVWTDFFTALGLSVQTASQRVGIPAALTAQSASISATDFSGGNLTSGMYRISYYARITTPGDISSSLTLTFDWQDGGVAVSQADTAMTANTTSTIGYETIPIHIDDASPVRYSTTYASLNPGIMQYALFVALERLDV